MTSHRRLPAKGLTTIGGLLIAASSILFPVSSASAAAPAWGIQVTHSPATFHRGEVLAEFPGDLYQVHITNTGDAATTGPIIVTDTLPVGLTIAPPYYNQETSGAGFFKGNCTGDGKQPIEGASVLSCSSEPGASIQPGETVSMPVLVSVSKSAPDTVLNTAAVSGGSAPASASAEDSTPIADRVPFGIKTFTSRTTDESGADYTNAGGHPYQNRTRFTFPLSDAEMPVEYLKDAGVELPTGFFGNPAATTRCQISKIPAFHEFIPGSICPVGSLVGTAAFGNSSDLQLYNVKPERGNSAQFAFNAGGTIISLAATPRPRTESYGLTISSVSVTRITLAPTFTISSFTTVFNGLTSAGTEAPFLSNPVNCSDSHPTWKLNADSWENPGRISPVGVFDLSDPNWKMATFPAPPVTGCDDPALTSQFQPTIETKPLQGGGPVQADQPSGLAVDLDFPQSNDPTDSNTTFDPSLPQAPEPKDITVKLPAGLSISPSSASGLSGCSDLASDPAGDQVHYDTTDPVTCPAAANIGSATATSPLLASHDPVTDAVTGAEPIPGDVYLLKPHPGDLVNGQDGKFRLLIQLENPRYGINFKLPGIAFADKQTGQLTTVFTDNPQLPAKHLQVNLKPGPRAPLATPVTCGSGLTTTTDLVPWGTPDVPDANPTADFDIKSGPNGTGCVATPGQRPFAPTISAGTESAKAGASTPFVLKLTRNDGEQELRALDVTTPPGFTAKLAGVGTCSDAAIAAASARSGADEQANPSCPISSQVGTVTAGAGPGSNPYYASGKAYLAGPYKGAPLSFVFVTPAVAGPFDLGDVVIRAATFLNTSTAQVTVKTDPLPQMLDGVPLRLRSIEARLDRSDFTLNPTDCQPMSVSAVVDGSNGATANPTQPFQVGSCKDLGFKPTLKLALKGPVGRRAHPSLRASLTARPGDANIARAQVKLPRAAFLDNAHIGEVCTRVQFAAKNCPAGSIYGTATATTPLLDYPLSGNVYLRSSSHQLPDLVVAFQGPSNQPIEIELAGKTDSVKGALRNTFEAVPDVPVTKFNLTLFGGKKGLIIMSSGFCAHPQADIKLSAQNGKEYDTTPKVSGKCSKKKHKTKSSKSEHQQKRFAMRLAALRLW